MTAVVDQILDGSSLQRTRGKWSKVRVAHVSGLTGSDTYEVELAAINASGMPAYGSALGASAPADGMYLVGQSVSRSNCTADQARVILTYETPDGSTSTKPNPTDATVYEFGTLTNQDTLVNKPDLSAITVTYNGKVYSAQTSVDFTTDTIRITRIETSTAPGDLARAVRNKVNSSTWNGDSAGGWRCTTVAGRKVTGTSNQWEMTYDFLYSATGHQPISYYHGDDGLIPADVVRLDGHAAGSGNGSLCIAYYGTANFASIFP